MKKIIPYVFVAMAGLVVVGCHNKTTGEGEEDVSPTQAQTPVTVTTVSSAPLVEYVELNATSSFLQENIVKSNIIGYITDVNTKPGEYVTAGQVLFVLKTKEAESLGNAIDRLDSSFHFSGVTRIRASQPGYITALTHQVGDYVQDGEQLAAISNSKSFGFILNVPYELHKYVSLKKRVQVTLPDSTRLDGVVSLFMPGLDSVSQTQQVLIKVNSAVAIPENLIARVRILKTEKATAESLPKQAVLSNDSQTEFWVMKMIDSVTAVKVSVTTGIEISGRVEILTPKFSASDKIVLSGNYGLPDTARVRVTNND